MELAKENQFGVLLPNGSWTGLRGQVQRGVSELDAKIPIIMITFLFI